MSHDFCEERAHTAVLIFLYSFRMSSEEWVVILFFSGSAYLSVKVPCTINQMERAMRYKSMSSLTLIHDFVFTQVLTELYLRNNQIGDNGAQTLADALKVNRVSYCFSICNIFMERIRKVIRCRRTQVSIDQKWVCCGFFDMDRIDFS